MTTQKNIVYVNFTPYENAGKILNYLTHQFRTVLVFSFKFHSVTTHKHSDVLTIYHKGKKKAQHSLIHAPVLSTLTFFLLPVRSLLICAQIIFYLLRLRKIYGPYHIYFTVNAFTAYIGNILRSLGLVQKTVFWVWDYYPLNHKNPIVRSMRWLYWQFDKPASTQADKTVFLNRRLELLRKQMGILPHDAHYPVIPIGTNPNKPTAAKSGPVLKLVFFGVIKRSQGLDLVFSQNQELSLYYKRIELHIIGNGPDKRHYQHVARNSTYKTHFYGYLKDDNTVMRIISACHIGVAPYVPEESNVSFYSDPSKIKAYLSVGVPVITTNVFTFSKEIAKTKSGIIINYFDPHTFISAITKIMSQLPIYQHNAYLLSHKYTYGKLYPKLFSGV